jgi:hypothetical protein
MSKEINQESMSSEEDFNFDNRWIPIIRKLREKDKDGLIPSMAKCLVILKNELAPRLALMDEMAKFIIHCKQNISGGVERCYLIAEYRTIARPYEEMKEGKG